MARRKQGGSAALNLVPDLLSLSQAAARAGKTTRTLQRWVECGLLDHRWVGDMIVTTVAALEHAIKTAPTAGRPKKPKE